MGIFFSWADLGHSGVSVGWLVCRILYTQSFGVIEHSPAILCNLIRLRSFYHNDHDLFIALPFYAISVGRSVKLEKALHLW